MSLDANYLLVYDNLSYASPTPMAKDIEYLETLHGGHFEFVQATTVYWEKPKYRLHPNEVQCLLADQVIERLDCERWEIIK